MSNTGDSATPAAEPDAEIVAAAALACEGVHALTRGLDVVEIATYLPGRRIHGVRVAPGRAEVHIVTEYGANMVEVADRVRAAVLAAATVGTAPPPRVDVFVDDIFAPDEQGDVAPAAAESADSADSADSAPPGIPGEVP